MRVLLFLFLLFPCCLDAQLNESDTVKIKANLSITGFYQGGNVQTAIFRANSALMYKPWEKWVFKTQNSYVKQAFGGDLADEDVLSLNFLYFDPEKRVYPLALGFISKSFRREIDLRTIVGAGVTFRLLDHEENWLKASITWEYEQTRFDQADFNRDAYDGETNINTLRGTIWMNGKFHLFEKRMIFGFESYFQPSVLQSDNFRWQADLNLDLPLWKWLNFRINYLHTFENVVVVGQETQDRILSFGFTLKTVP
ncbi:MAG: DUF481 domain-containing protein [Bacteroidota bacterium]